MLLRLSLFLSCFVILCGGHGQVHPNCAVLSNQRGYKGVLLIQNADSGAGFGTAFFEYVVNQIIFAKRNNLLPYVHFQPNTGNVDLQANISQLPVTTFTTVGMPRVLPDLAGQFSQENLPSKIAWSDLMNVPKSLTTVNVSGTGLWTDYFEPLVSGFSLNMNCSFPLIILPHTMVDIGIHVLTDWSVRAYYYSPVPSNNPSDTTKFDETWYFRNRLIASSIVSEMYRVKSRFRDAVELRFARAVESIDPQGYQAHIARHTVGSTGTSDSFSTTSTTTSTGNNNNTAASASASHYRSVHYSEQSSVIQPYISLGLHIRGTDKEAVSGRKIVPVATFLDFVIKFLANIPTSTKGLIFVATDDLKVVKEIQSTWPAYVLNHTFIPQEMLRSSGESNPFNAHRNERHRVNTEVLHDLIMLSQCDFFLHGHSALSEAVIYSNLKLHQRSVDLEFDEGKRQMSIAQFGDLVHSYANIKLFMNSR